MAIKFDYNLTIQQAKKLDELATDMQNQSVKRMGIVYENVNAAWTGQASKVYLNYIQGVQSDLTKKVKYLHETAEFLRVAAKKLKLADATAKQAAQKI
jgi:uncharacterized protein YukE